MWRKLLLLTGFAIILAGCRGATSQPPTPFPTSGPTTTSAASGPVVLTVTELMNAPGLYRDATVQLTGQLSKQPIIVCISELYSSPASWGLGEAGLLAPAGGFDEQVRSLLPNDLTMTVEGRWRRWEGNVGCGKNAQRQEIWYVAVDRILSPSPLTQITLTPASGIGISAVTAEPSPLATAEGEDEGAPSPQQTVQPVETEELPGGYPAGTPSTFPGGQEITATLPIAQTPVASQTLTTTTPTNTFTPQVSGSMTPETMTVTPSGTITSTPTGTLTVTPTSSAVPGETVNKGNLDDVMIDSFTISTLEAGKADVWEVNLVEGDQLYVYAVAPIPADIVLSIFKDGQAVVNQQNITAAGMPEFINAPPLTGFGTYEIHVADGGGTPAQYGLTMYTDPEFPVMIGGIVAAGNPRSAISLPEAAIHFWFLEANAGQELAITLRPTNNTDVAGDLYGPDTDYINTIDSEYEGVEEFRVIPITDNGLHALRVFEYTLGEAMIYDLEINFQ